MTTLLAVLVSAALFACFGLAFRPRPGCGEAGSCGAGTGCRTCEFPHRRPESFHEPARES
jgi:hypothetical protein